MNLILATRKKSSIKTECGITKIGCKELIVIDSDTGNELSNKVGLVWGDRDLIIGGDRPILTEKHLMGDPDNASYLVLVIRCDNAIEL